jgi:hypothetical protein
MSEPKTRTERIAERLLADRAIRAERQQERQQERQRDQGPQWRHAIGFDPYLTTNWSANPGYLPKIPMRMGPVGFYIHCKACNAEFESKGWACCPTCMELPAEERRAMRPAFSGRMCQAPGCENQIPITARAGSMYCSGACRQRAARAKDVTDNGAPQGG